ncbi:MAG: glycogen synthase GlgA [Bryobacteraceae bacterium]
MARILMAASEASPFAKTGGLADVLGALPPELARQGHEVAVLIPRYRSVPMDGATRVADPFPVWFDGHSVPAIVWRRERNGVPYFFLDVPSLFDRDGLYGGRGGDYPDNAARFGFFSRAVLEVARSLFRPQILHCHDWQTGLVPAYLRGMLARDPTFAAVRTLFTIHNLGYQGRFLMSDWRMLGLEPRQLGTYGVEFFGDISFLKAGIFYTDAVSTVSPGYAREIQTPEYGFGLDGLLRARADSLFGIVNGVDYQEWNPGTDPHIAAHYSATDLEGKRVCKRDLLDTFGLPVDDVASPLIGLVTRFAEQKGIDLIREAAGALVEAEVLFTILGSGEPEDEQFFMDLAERHPRSVGVRVGYDNPLAHKIEAGSDMFLMPSRYEPCGLNQIYSLRYGTLPIVRATGGLDDTIREGTGFKFWEYSGAALLDAIRLALETYRDPERWTAMMRNAMREDFSWRHSAGEYSLLYQKLLEG